MMEQLFKKVFLNTDLLMYIYTFVPGIKTSEWIEKSRKEPEKMYKSAIHQKYDYLIYQMIKADIPFNGSTIYYAVEFGFTGPAYYMAKKSGLKLDLSYWMTLFDDKRTLFEALNDRMPLMEALDGGIARGDCMTVKKALDKGFMFHKQSIDRIAARGYIDMLRLLLQYKNTNMYPAELRHQKSYALIIPPEDMQNVDYYMQMIEKINKNNEALRFQATIHGACYAAYNGYTEIIRLLIEHEEILPVDIFRAAIDGSNIDTVKLLVEKGYSGDSFEYNLAKCREHAIVEYVLENTIPDLTEIAIHAKRHYCTIGALNAIIDHIIITIDEDEVAELFSNSCLDNIFTLIENEVTINFQEYFDNILQEEHDGLFIEYINRYWTDSLLLNIVMRKKYRYLRMLIEMNTSIIFRDTHLNILFRNGKDDIIREILSNPKLRIGKDVRLYYDQRLGTNTTNLLITKEIDYNVINGFWDKEYDDSETIEGY